ncbi:MAG: DUF5597 domain-containing protein [Bryobacteraceae bacterium]|nr:DUF5597 domain-containing protein [Bryobacteraceae bacterium]
MNRRLAMVAVLVYSGIGLCAQPSQTVSPDLPYLRKAGSFTQLIVDGKPFLMLAGELHNSSASSTEYMAPIWRKLAAMNLNTVIGTVSWELLEPEEGKFDFRLVDDQIREARRHNMRLVLIWFATWKNANASYVPMWVKTDLKRFPRVQSKDGTNQDSLTPLGEASLAADAKAFRALMRHIREVDTQHTVIMMQVENEAGLLGDSRDRSPLAEKAWSSPVPSELMSYLQKNRDRLIPEVAQVWGAQGYRTSGTWPEVFGTTPHSDEVFMAWHIGRYIGKVAEAGKAEHPIPMYANAWLVQNEKQLPGGYPSGGPVSRVMDIWRAAAPAIDLLAPDIYLPDFKGVCASYTRSGNPLFIPEARASVPNLLWAIGQHAALGYSPFGIDSLNEDHPIGQAYQVLGGMIPILMRYQPEGRVMAVVEGEERSQTVRFGGYQMNITFGGMRRPGAATPQPTAGSAQQPAGPSGYGLIIHTGPDEFLFVGTGLNVTFAADSPGPRIARLGTVDEGRFEHGIWVPGRRFNGDETGGGNRVMLRGPGLAVQKVRLYRHD